MRPLELRLQGFRSYHEEQKFDFQDRRLIAIVGPNGAGKSTLLDAVAFALYGRTPRIGKATSTLINQRAKEAAVSLRFEAAGREWEAVRRLRRRGANEHALYRYDDGYSSEPTEQWVMEREMNYKLAELLGLDFEAFSRSVLLAQGRFAEFLGAGIADKIKVLKGLFNFERLDAMKQRAKEWAKDVKNKIEVLNMKLDNAKQAQTRCEDLREKIKIVQARQEQLEVAFPEFEELDDQLQGFRQALAADQKHQAMIEGLKLPDPKQAEKIITEAEQAAAKLEEASRVAAIANDKIKSPEFQQRYKCYQKAKVLIGGLPGLQKAEEVARQRAIEANQKREYAEEQLKKGYRDLKSAQDALSEAKERAKKAKKALQVAEAALLNARHQHMAAELRSSLEQGDDCPVCEQSVHEIPPQVTGTGVPQAEKDVKEAREESEKATVSLQEATGIEQAAVERLKGAEKTQKDSQDMTESADEEHSQAHKDLEKCLIKIVELLGEGDPFVLLGEEESSLDALREQAENARAAEVEADSFGKRVQQELRKLWDYLLGLAAQLKMEISGAGDDPQNVREALCALHQERDRIIAELTNKLYKIHKDIEDAKVRWEALEIKYEVEKSVKEDLADIKAKFKLWSERLEEEEKIAAELEDLINQIETLQSKMNNYERLDKDLTDAKGKFVYYLLEAKRMELSELGSEHFERLSSGRYRFSEDGKFDVIDLTLADAARGSDSLSGGETFLASLALAVALAEMVGREGGRLDAFMLDEGFGSLDPEHLDLAMEGVEKLVSDSGQRLVLLVSHVAELRERVDDLLILEKDPVTGDTKIVKGDA